MVFEVITNYYLLGSFGKNLHTTVPVFAKYLCKVDELREKYMLFLRPFREKSKFYLRKFAFTQDFLFSILRFI
jgi:hypothetical protein